MSLNVEDEALQRELIFSFIYHAALLSLCFLTWARVSQENDFSLPFIVQTVQPLHPTRHIF